MMKQKYLLIGTSLICALLLGGVVHIAIADNGTSNREVEVQATPLVWQSETVDGVGDAGRYASLAQDAAGHFHVSYYDVTGSNLRYAYYDGSSWVTETVDSSGVVGQYTSLALDTSGDPHISYYDVGNTALKYAYWNGTTWITTAVDNTGDVGEYTSLALDVNNVPHISYYDATSVIGYLKYAYLNGSTWISETVDNLGGVGWHTSLALADGLYPRISYYFFNEDQLKYASLISSTWVLTDVNNVMEGGQYTFLALDANGRPHISYFANDGDQLKYAYHNGVTWINTTVSGVGVMAVHTSLALDVNDRPHIAYYDDLYYRLRYVYHDGSAWISRTVDSTTYLPAYPSLLLDASDYPHIGYYHDADGLKHTWMEPCVLPDMMDLSGPDTIISGTWNTFTATVNPPTATLPITFVWHIPGWDQMGGTLNSTESVVSFQALVTGTHVITVTATNCGGTVTTTRQVVIEEPVFPDLTITDVWDDGTEIWYQLLNTGELTATASHSTTLSVDGTAVSSQIIGVPLAPAERINRALPYSWVCSGFSDTIRVTADAGAVLDEESETNNSREESWLCDQRAPQFTWGPTATQVTASSVTIEWGTDEASSSAVSYGETAGEYSGFEYNPVDAQTHAITLTGLSPSTVYHYKIRSTDPNGYQNYSDGHFFETLPTSSTPPPQSTMVVTYANTLFDLFAIQAAFTDTSSIERVEFYLDDELVDTDYADSTGEFTGYFSPFALGMNGGTFFSQQYALQAKAFTWAGQGYVNPYLFEPARDSIEVDLEILSPDSDYTLYIQGDTVPAGTSVDIDVYATQYDWKCTWGGSTTPRPGTAPNCGDVAVAVEYVEFFVDNLVHTSYPANQSDFDHTYTLDLSGVGPYPRTVRVRAYDSDYMRHDAQTTISIEKATPSINLTRNVSRIGNHFKVQLTVENAATATGYARIAKIKDNVTAFQVVHKATTNYTVTSSYAYWTGSFARGNFVTIDFHTQTDDYIILVPGEQYTVEYLLVPILFENPVSFQIGDRDVTVYYKESSGESKTRRFDRPVYLLQGWTSDAIATANYMIVTHPKHLFSHYDNDDTNTLLSTMAHLAALKQGVLGYLETDDPLYVLDDLVEPGGGWATRLHPNFTTVGGGYMLIVGEIEIVPAFYKGGFDLNWSDSDVDEVYYSDHRYAHTKGSGAPDLIVGRAIGDSAAVLAKSIQTSINVHEGVAGYGYDRSHAVIVSGLGGSKGSFQSNVEIVEDILQGDGIAVNKIHWEFAAFPRSFSFDYAKHDGFATGDVNGDGYDEILVADRHDHIYILNQNANVIGGFDRDYEEGDGFAVGDVNGNGYDEIIIGDRNDNIYVYNRYGTQLKRFSRNFAKFDGLTVGDVTGDSKEEIIMGDRDDRIYVFDMNGNVLKELGLVYDRHDGLATGDVNGDGKDEIVLARRSPDRIYVYNADGILQTSFEVEFDQGDRLAVGDVLGDSKDDILVGDRNDHIYIYVDNGTGFGPNPYQTVYCDFEEFDGLAVRRIPGSYNDEIWHADRNDRLRVADAFYPGQAFQVFDNVTSNRDVMYFSGHGNTNIWGPALGTGHFPLDFGTTNPFVLAPTCLSGNYQRGNDYGIAEAFLENGAGVYIGSTEVSPIAKNCYAGEWFFNHWEASETIGKAFLDLERNRWGKDGSYDWWRFWVYEYNLYGDPKFGDPSAVTPLAMASVAAVQQTPPVTLTIQVPDFVVTTGEDGYDYVDIPDGELLLEQDTPRIPYWSVSVEYPAGYRVQNVTLMNRSSLVITTGLNVTTTQMYIACVELACPSRLEQNRGDQALAQDDVWIPGLDQEYDWTVLDNPDGSSTLVINMYPFYYQPLTQNTKFYKNYDLDIEVTTSTVGVDLLATDKQVYPQGENVLIDLWVNNSGNAQDVIVDAVVKIAVTGDVVDGLLLRNLHDLDGQATFVLEWNSSGFTPDEYYVEAELRDNKGNLLDSATEDFTLGITSGEVTAFTATPDLFQVGDTVSISMVFSNTGTVPITGTAVIQVQSADGLTVTSTFTHAIAGLAPANAATFNDAWDTTGVEEGDYRILGYVTYAAKASEPKYVAVSTKSRIYLPLILRIAQ